MSITNTSENRFNKAHLSLLLSSLLLVIAGYYLWQFWPQILVTSIQAQKQLYGQFSALLSAAKQHDVIAGVVLIGVSFLYGLLHSLGPGHGKVIMSTYVATHPTKVKLSLTLTLISALLQALVAILLVSVLLLVFSASMKVINYTATQFIQLSFFAILLLGLGIVWRNIRLLQQDLKAQKHKHTHTHNCSCGHSHSADASQVNAAASLREYVGVILSIGLRPCSGAIMVLLFASMLDIYWLGMLSAVAMAFGTALTTSIIALMTISGKKILSVYSQKHRDTKQSMAGFYSHMLAIFGGVILVIMAGILLASEPVAMTTLFTR